MAATRDSSPVRLAGYCVALWGLLVSTMWMAFGDVVTSRQWTYLMSVPGGKWSWALTFGAFALLLLYAQYRVKHTLIVVGALGVGAPCLLVMFLYLTAPLYVEDLFTLGWLPWLLSGGAAIGVAAMNRNDCEW